MDEEAATGRASLQLLHFRSKADRILPVAKMPPTWLLLSNDPSTFVAIPPLSDIHFVIVPCMSSVFRTSPSS